jgi:hypothetical protein
MPLTRIRGVKMHLILLLIVMLGIQLSPMPAQAQATPPAAQAQTIKYLDLTAVENGWGVGVATAVQASRGKKVVIVSYLDPQQTRALYDAALRFMEKSAQPRVVGVMRSPRAPATVKEEKNPLGWDIFFDGAIFLRDLRPDARFSREDHLDATLRSIQRNYFAGQER